MGGESSAQTSASLFLLRKLLSRAGALPRGASRRASVQIVGFEPFAPPSEGSGAPKVAGRNADPLAALRLGLSLQRKGTADP